VKQLAESALPIQAVGTTIQVIVAEDAMRSYRLTYLLVIGIALAAASTAAGAQDAYTAHVLNLRTGPD
jgi:uncharacterized protein YraI